MKKTSLIVCLIVSMGFGGVAQAQTKLSRFPLLKAVPADVYIAVAHKDNPDRKYLDEYWGRVYRAFHQSGVLKDVWELIADSIESDEKADLVEGLKDKFSDKLQAIDLGELFKKESIFCGRFYSPTATVSTFEGVVMGRMTEATAQKNYKAIKSLMEELAKLSDSHGEKGSVSVAEKKDNGMTVATLAKAEFPEMALRVAQWSDIIAISIGSENILNETLGSLQSASSTPRLIDGERFKKGLAALPAAQDKLVFWDTSKMFDNIGKSLRAAQGGEETASAKKSERKKAPSSGKGKKKRPPKGEDDDSAKTKSGDGDASGGGEGDDDMPLKLVHVIAKAIDEISFIDYSMDVEWTEGHKVYSEEVAILKPGAKTHGLGKIFTSDASIKDFAKFVPEEATEFSVSAGVNWKSFYQFARDFVSQQKPFGDQALAQFDTMMQSVGFNIEEDLLNWIEGPIVTVKTEKNVVFMLKVSDEEKASAQMQKLTDLITGMMGKDSGLTITPVEIGGRKGFNQASHPMMMMLGGMTPVWGCANGYLIIASAPASVRLCLDTAKGSHPNITHSDRWKAEALQPKGGSLCSISFTDEREKAAQMQQALGGASMALGFASMGMGADTPAPVRALVSKLPSLLGKLSVVAGKLNFFQSEAKYVTFEGNGWRTRKIQNYKKDVPDDSKEEASSDEEKPEKVEKKAPRHGRHGNKASKSTETKEGDSKKDKDSDD